MKKNYIVTITNERNETRIIMVTAEAIGEALMYSGIDKQLVGYERVSGIAER